MPPWKQGALKEENRMPLWKNGAREKTERGQDTWIVNSMKPEYFIPGLVIGFLLGLLVEFPKSFVRGSSKTHDSSKAKNQNSEGELKMVLVVRQDLKMGSGKIASQCAHAATGIYGELMRSQRSLLNKWEQAGQPKIVVTCKNQQEMNNLRAAAEKIGLPTFTVADAGRTQGQELFWPLDQLLNKIYVQVKPVASITKSK
ncbi:uncharacterized protein LOC131063494 isoform X4 [Cryptomeria japonica]|uniref:uncharacterized protein LOC131063494 isoform X4 n=1 Tax=Cryptomeria japonica TaxID=3369 RepID=UPI0025AC6B0E|nr:uncharacterized protein LOC131063494 isoform X4 [Cryptomeria japonica]